MLSPPQRNGRANLVGRTARGFLALPRQSPLATAAQIRQGNLPPPPPPALLPLPVSARARPGGSPSKC